MMLNFNDVLHRDEKMRKNSSVLYTTPKPLAATTRLLHVSPFFSLFLEINDRWMIANDDFWLFFPLFQTPQPCCCYLIVSTLFCAYLYRLHINRKNIYVIYLYSYRNCWIENYARARERDTRTRCNTMPLRDILECFFSSQRFSTMIQSLCRRNSMLHSFAFICTRINNSNTAHA